MEATGIKAGLREVVRECRQVIPEMTGIEIESIFRGSSIHGLHMLTF